MRRTRGRLWAAALIVACAVPCAHADTLYVIEQLYVTVNSAADGSGERVGQIKSADSVELIERQGDQAHVRLASGEEGWVKSSYLSADPPLRPLLTARTQELEKVRKEKAQLETELAAAKSAVVAANAAAKAASKNVSAPVAAAPTAAATPGSVKSESTTANTESNRADSSRADSSRVELNRPDAADDGASEAANETPSQGAPPLFQDEPMMPSRPSWLIAVASALVALGIGFALGWRVLDRRIRAKYGGLRIY